VSSDILRFPVERCRPSNTQEVEAAITQFERALAAYRDAHRETAPIVWASMDDLPDVYGLDLTEDDLLK
jgi:hypothetical protein